MRLTTGEHQVVIEADEEEREAERRIVVMMRGKEIQGGVGVGAVVREVVAINHGTVVVGEALLNDNGNTKYRILFLCDRQNCEIISITPNVLYTVFVVQS